jgi:hypothetical protein
MFSQKKIIEPLEGNDYTQTHLSPLQCSRSRRLDSARGKSITGLGRSKSAANDAYNIGASI